MKKGTHPEYKEATVRCVCGNEFKTRSTLEEISVEICSNCHPFFTGQQKLIDSAGRVERFMRKYGLKPGEASDSAMKGSGEAEGSEQKAPTGSGETADSAGEDAKTPAQEDKGGE